MTKVDCEKFDKIQNDLITQALSFYDTGKDIKFWSVIEALQKILDVKFSLSCNSKRSKKKT